MTVKTVLDNATLTAAYAGNQEVRQMRSAGSIIAFVDYSKGDETSMELQFEMSHDGTNFFVPTTSAGVSLAQILTVTATGKYRVNIPLVSDGTEIIGAIGQPEAHYRLSAKATGGTPTGTCTVEILESPAYPKRD